MIYPSGGYKIYMAVAPVDFRKGMDGLTAYVANNFELDPYGGSFFVFRSKTGDKIKVLLWDGTGMVLIQKRLHASKFVWPAISGGTLSLSKTQFEALFEGVDWRRVVPPRLSAPAAAQSI